MQEKVFGAPAAYGRTTEFKLCFPEGTLIDTNALARLTKTSKSYWERLRRDNVGPAYIKRGRIVLYRIEDVEEFLSLHIVETSTDGGSDVEW